MTEQDQQNAIAEACGWSKRAVTMTSHVEPPFGTLAWIGPNEQLGAPPDYVNDLNAMHEAEGVFEWVPDDEYCQAAQYYDHLVLVCGNESDPPDVYEWHLIRATAKQRAEAFLKTLGKWTP